MSRDTKADSLLSSRKQRRKHQGEEQVSLDLPTTGWGHYDPVEAKACVPQAFEVNPCSHPSDPWRGQTQWSLQVQRSDPAMKACCRNTASLLLTENEACHQAEAREEFISLNTTRVLPSSWPPFHSDSPRLADSPQTTIPQLHVLMLPPSWPPYHNDSPRFWDSTRSRVPHLHVLVQNAGGEHTG